MFFFTVHKRHYKSIAFSNNFMLYCIILILSFPGKHCLFTLWNFYIRRIPVGVFSGSQKIYFKFILGMTVLYLRCKMFSSSWRWDGPHGKFGSKGLLPTSTLVCRANSRLLNLGYLYTGLEFNHLHSLVT